MTRQADEPIRIVPYDPEWPARFEQERAALAAVIGRWTTGGIHHIGSTAVPGLDAKPIVDILVGVRDLEESRECFESLARLDYMHPEVTEEYAALKRALASRFEQDREAYTDAKSEFIHRVLR